MKINFDKNTDIDTTHIDVLDGIRAMAVIIVVWFHIWQQCWLIPVLHTPALAFLGLEYIDLDWLPRTGYMMVTMMIFLSGFCLYLPYARQAIEGGPVPSTKTFFKKRVARILPSYLFSILVVLVYDIFVCAYTDPTFGLKDDPSFMATDILSHLTFTFNLIPSVSSNTLLNGVLWTIALEVQFYIVFPIIQKCFSKKPVLTYIIMNVIAYAYSQYAIGQTNVPFLLHQLPSYLGVYANGFLGAKIFVGMANSQKRNKYQGLIATIISLGCIYIYRLYMLNLASSDDLNIWQLQHRFSISILFLIFVISTALALSWYRFIFSNKVARFFSTISFNLYIWHQFLCTAFKNNHIPYYEGDEPPNVYGDKPWMWKLFILSVVASLAAACFATYFIERPASKLIMKIGSKKTQK